MNPDRVEIKYDWETIASGIHPSLDEITREGWIQGKSDVLFVKVVNPAPDLIIRIECWNNTTVEKVKDLISDYYMLMSQLLLLEPNEWIIEYLCPSDLARIGNNSMSYKKLKVLRNKISWTYPRSRLNKRSWKTRCMKKTVISLCKRGLFTAVELSSCLNTSIESIYRALVDCDYRPLVKRQKCFFSKRELELELMNSTYDKVAQKYGITRQRIHQLRIKNGLPDRRVAK